MAEGGTVRIRAAGKCALLNPETGLHESPSAGEQFSLDHPLVRAHRWAFASDEEIAAEQEEARNVTSVRIADVVEQATANPGEKRRVGRPRKDLDKA